MNIFKVAGITAIVIFALSLVASSMGVIESGTKGVKYSYGVASEVINEGVYFTTPFVTHVKEYDIRTQKEVVKASASSKDLQTVTVDAAVNYSLDANKLLDLVKNIGDGYKATVLQPSIQEAVKSITAKYTAEELITKREEVKNAILKLLIEKMQSTGILISGINITDLEFSASFNTAIEAKVTAEQNALAQKNKLEQVKYEAEQRVTQATAEAEAIKIQAQGINSQGGADYVELKRIERWNGVLPQYVVGGATNSMFNMK